MNKVLGEMAQAKGTTPTALVIAWILRHPAGIQALVGSTNSRRVAEICKASDITLTREEWYALYMAAGKQLP